MRTSSTVGVLNDHLGRLSRFATENFSPFSKSLQNTDIITVFRKLSISRSGQTLDKRYSILV